MNFEKISQIYVYVSFFIRIMDTTVPSPNFKKYEALRIKLKEMKESALKKRAELKIAKKNKTKIQREPKQEELKKVTKKRTTLSEERITRTDMSPSISPDKSKNTPPVQSNIITKKEEKNNTPNKPKDTSDRTPDKVKKNNKPKQTKATSDLNAKIIREKKQKLNGLRDKEFGQIQKLMRE